MAWNKEGLTLKMYSILLIQNSWLIRILMQSNYVSLSNFIYHKSSTGAVRWNNAICDNVSIYAQVFVKELNFVISKTLQVQVQDDQIIRSLLANYQPLFKKIGGRHEISSVSKSTS